MTNQKRYGNTIRYFDRNDKLLDERTFEISVTKDMVIKTGINKDKDTVLQIDKNKDGKVDEKISASKNENIKKQEKLKWEN